MFNNHFLFVLVKEENKFKPTKESSEYLGSVAEARGCEKRDYG